MTVSLTQALASSAMALSTGMITVEQQSQA
jgi:hypothetical protein